RAAVVGRTALADPVRDDRAEQPLHRATGSRGDLRSGGRRASRRRGRTGHAPVPRRRRIFARGAGRALRPAQALPSGAANPDGTAEAAVPPHERPLPRRAQTETRSVLLGWLSAGGARRARGRAPDALERD